MEDLVTALKEDKDSHFFLPNINNVITSNNDNKKYSQKYISYIYIHGFIRGYVGIIRVIFNGTVHNAILKVDASNYLYDNMIF